MMNFKPILLLLCVAFTSPLFSQTLHDVAVTNNVFTPENITINVGDTVRWTNLEGLHNVEGQVAEHGENPEPFGNGIGVGWVYEFVFTIPGFYTYDCDPHQFLGMIGTVTVLPLCNETTLPTNLAVAVAPNGTNASLSWDALDGADAYQAKGRLLGGSGFASIVTFP